MKVKRLQMQSFRGIGDLTLDFYEAELTVLIGINGELHHISPPFSYSFFAKLLIFYDKY
ncbi:hypothetical protein GTQ43_21165 [Nostoc sp. KVJ3]|nr:hypothetical protein [Nostoc sp. KVJ3]